MSNSAAESALELGLKLLDQDRLVDAQKQFLAATQLAPNLAIAHYFLGVSFFNQNRFAEAEAPLRFAVQLDTRDAENLMMLGRSLMRQNKLVEAEACFKKGSELDPNERQYRDEWVFINQYEPFRTLLAEQRSGKTTQPSTQPPNGGLFAQLRSRQPIAGSTPDSPTYMESLQRVVPYQTLTKAIYYFSVGYFTGAKTLLDTCSKRDYRNTEINNGIIWLHNQAASRSELPGAGGNALQAGNPSQVPYSSVLWAIENGHTDQDVIKGIIELIKLQGH